MEIRRRNVPSANSEAASVPKLITNLDVFTKLPKECTKPTKSGGLVTLITICLMLLLIKSEISNYINSSVKYSYEIDKNVDGKIRVNVDITVASKCETISLDAVDTVGTPLITEDSVKYTPVNFELSQSQKSEFHRHQLLTQILRSEKFSLHKILWKQSNIIRTYKSLNRLSLNDIPKSKDPNACRMIGTFYLKKVAGNIHILFGKPLLEIGSSHLHIAPIFNTSPYNFSHRIYHFSFGEPNLDQIDPLEAVEAVTADELASFQYFVTMVPTRVVYSFETKETYQYALTMKNRTINHSKGSHGLPGIFFNYDTFPLVVNIVHERELIGTFLARLAALIGGLFSTIGLIRQAYFGLPDLFTQTRLGRKLSSSWIKLLRSVQNKLKLFTKLNLSNDENLNQNMEPILNPDSDT